jgi:DNA-binding transcriptional ArsR family regulator
MATPEHIKKTHALLAALMHPARRRILRAMDDKREMCPRDLARELDRALDNVSYHVRVLAVCGALKSVRTEETGGTTMHFYRRSLKPKWAREVLDATAEEQPGEGG